MRLKKDLRHGIVRATIESADDLWVLRSVITPGDSVSGMTERKLKLSGREEKSSAVRKRMRLTITVEKTEYASETGSLRVLGTITEGPEDVPRGEHHSFILEPGCDVTIRKETWPHYQVRRLEEARREPPLLVLLFDREEAKLYGVSRRGVEELARLKGSVAKKGMEQKTKDFYGELVAALEERAANYEHIICAAPAFWREYLERALPDELRKKSVFTTISAVDKTAIREILARPEVKKLLEQSTALRELELVEEAMKALAKEKLAYGFEEVKQRVNEGNVSTLIVTERYLSSARQEGGLESVEQVLRSCEETKGRIHILMSEAAEQVDPLGGIVGILRW